MTSLIFFFADEVPAYDEIRLLGDNFVARSFRDYVKHDGEDMFMNQMYDIELFCSSRFSSNNTNMISRIEGSFARSLNHAMKLPKYFLIVLDDDLLQYLSYEDCGLAGILGSWIERLISSFEDMIAARKKMLKEKALRHDYPMIYWVLCPHHRFFKNNTARTKLNVCLETVMKPKNNMRVIKLKEVWDYKNNHLVNEGTGTFISYGFSKYWRAVDAAFRYNAIRHDLFLCKERKNCLQKILETDQRAAAPPTAVDKMPTFFKNNNKHDRFHWNHDTHRGKRRCLPKLNYHEY